LGNVVRGNVVQGIAIVPRYYFITSKRKRGKTVFSENNIFCSEANSSLMVPQSFRVTRCVCEENRPKSKVLAKIYAKLLQWKK
jgi:hypothetical protein